MEHEGGHSRGSSRPSTPNWKRIWISLAQHQHHREYRRGASGNLCLSPSPTQMASAPAHAWPAPSGIKTPTLPIEVLLRSRQAVLLPMTWAAAPSTCGAHQKPHPLQSPLYDIRAQLTLFFHTCPLPKPWGLQAPGSLAPQWQQRQDVKGTLLSEAMVTSRPRLLPGPMSGSMVPLQSGSELMSVAQGNTRGHTDAWSLGGNL